MKKSFSFLPVVSLVLLAGLAQAQPDVAGIKPAKAAKKPVCAPNEEALKVTAFQDLPDRIHIEWQDARTGDKREALEVTKPYHSGYSRSRYLPGSVVCAPTQEPPAGG